MPARRLKMFLTGPALTSSDSSHCLLLPLMLSVHGQPISIYIYIFNISNVWYCNSALFHVYSRIWNNLSFALFCLFCQDAKCQERSNNWKKLHLCCSQILRGQEVFNMIVLYEILTRGCRCPSSSHTDSVIPRVSLSVTAHVCASANSLLISNYCVDTLHLTPEPSVRPLAPRSVDEAFWCVRSPHLSQSTSNNPAPRCFRCVFSQTSVNMTQRSRWISVWRLHSKLTCYTWAISQTWSQVFNLRQCCKSHERTHCTCVTGVDVARRT